MTNKRYTRNCDYCGKKYTGQGKRFCSKSCRAKAINPNKPNPEHLRKCGVCGKEFYYQPSNRSGRFCSRDCYNKAVHVNRECEWCHKPITPKNRNYNKKYCSLKCTNEAHINKIEKTCVVCSKKFMVKPSHSSQKYCSLKCSHIGNKSLSIGNKNPNWKGGISSVVGTISSPNRAYQKGKYYERKTRHILEGKGYYTIRSGASKGVWDIVAISSNDIILIQVKAGASHVTLDEFKKMEKFVVPKNCKKQLWRWLSQKKPLIQEIS